MLRVPQRESSEPLQQFAPVEVEALRTAHERRLRQSLGFPVEQRHVAGLIPISVAGYLRHDTRHQITVNLGDYHGTRLADTGMVGKLDHISHTSYRRGSLGVLVIDIILRIIPIGGQYHMALLRTLEHVAL